MEDTTVRRKAPTAKERKYDRQLRIWGPLGQRRLEEAHVLLINSGHGGVGVEVLKNLVLPGRLTIFCLLVINSDTNLC